METNEKNKGSKQPLTNKKACGRTPQAFFD